MPREVAPITREADQAHGSAMALKTVASMRRVSQNLTGAVDVVTTLFKGLADAGKKAIDRVGNHLSDVADALAELMSGGDVDDAAVTGFG